MKAELLYDFILANHVENEPIQEKIVNSFTV